MKRPEDLNTYYDTEAGNNYALSSSTELSDFVARFTVLRFGQSLDPSTIWLGNDRITQGIPYWVKNRETTPQQVPLRILEQNLKVEGVRSSGFKVKINEPDLQEEELDLLRANDVAFKDGSNLKIFRDIDYDPTQEERDLVSFRPEYMSRILSGEEPPEADSIRIGVIARNFTFLELGESRLAVLIGKVNYEDPDQRGKFMRQIYRARGESRETFLWHGSMRMVDKIRTPDLDKQLASAKRALKLQKQAIKRPLQGGSPGLVQQH